jgi:integrase
MRRPALLFTSIVALAAPLALLTATSCATYRQDLERARAHYEKNEYEPALALFRVLEPDVDSFSPAEYAQYSYSRGMTDFRLSSLVSSGNAAVDPKQSFRSHARHWLAVARAIEKQTPGGLTPDELQRLEEALKDLNRDVYGGGDSTPEGDGGAPAPKDKDRDKDKGASKPDKSDK